MNRFLPFFAGFFAFLGFEVAFRRPTFFIPILAAVVFATAVTIWLLCDRKFSRQFFLIIGGQTLLIGSTFGFLLFTERTLPRHIMALSLFVLLALIIEQFRFLRESGQEKAIGSMSGLLLLSYAATMFWASSSLYGLRVFLGAPILFLAIFIFLIAFFFHRAIFLNIDSALDVFFRALWIAVIAFELFVVVYASPASLAVDGALFAIPMAVFLNIYRLRLEDRLEKKTLARNILFGVLALIIIIFTAEWR